MNAEEILVTVLVMAAVAWLVWAELHSRRNIAASQKKTGLRSAAERRAET